MAQLPSWQSLDSGVQVPNGSGRIVAVVASEGAVEGRWAGRAALDLARAWSASGEKVILVDGALHYPSLHTHAGTENFEGLSDAALFGLSVGRIAKPVDDGAFFLITAGTAVADANAVAGSKRWATLLGGFMEAGVKLLLFVRDGDSGCAAFLGSASDIVVLSNKNEKVPAAVRDLEGMVRAVAGPGAGRPGVAAHGADSSDTPGVRPPAEWTIEGPGARQRLMMMAFFVVVLVAVLLLVLLGAAPIAEAASDAVDGVSLLTSRSVSVHG